MYCINCGTKIDGETKFCPKCGKEIAEKATAINPENSNEPLSKVTYFSLSPLGLYLYSVLTLNLFDIIWFGRNWSAIKIATNWKMSPFWRGIFGWLFSYEQFPLILKSAKLNGYQRTFSPAALSLAYIALCILADVFGKWSDSNSAVALSVILWSLVLLSPLPLLPVQNAINANNAVVDPNYVPKKNFSLPNIILLVILVLIVAAGTASIFLSN